MDFVRTPDERFENLADYPFIPNYTEVAAGDGGELRIHYVDEGPVSSDPILLLHGQPTWSYLYRFMIPALAAAGYRVLAPDLVGFGRSDKPTDRDSYTYSAHVGWMSEWLEQVDLNITTLFCQDWGGLIGMRLVAAYPERFARVVVANTALPTGMIPEDMYPQIKEIYKTLPVVEVSELGDRFRDTSGVPGFLYWRKFCAETPTLCVSDLMAFVSGDGRTEEHEQGDQVAGEGDPDGAARVGESCGELDHPRLVQRVQAAGKSHEREGGGEQPAQLAPRDRRQGVVEEGEGQRRAVGDRPDQPQGRQRQGQDQGFARDAAGGRQQQRAGDQYQPRRHRLNHGRSTCPPAAGRSPAPWRR